MKKGIKSKVIFILSVILLSFNLYAGTTNGLVAYFKFNGDYTDSSGNNTELLSKNINIVDNSLYLNGIYEYGRDPNGYKVKIPIDNFSYDAFTVSLDFYILNDKNLFVYNIITGGPSYRWFSLYADEQGYLYLTLNNQRYSQILDLKRVSFAKWHNIKCSFDLSQKKIIVIFDNNTETINLEPDFKFEVVGSEDEIKDKQFTFTNYSNGHVFYGYIDNLMIYNRALSLTELQQLNNYNDIVSATYNVDTGKINIHCFALGNSSYRLDLKVINTYPIQLEVTDSKLNNVGDCKDKEFVYYNSSTNILNIPYFVLGNSSYWLNMKVINISPVQFEVTNYGQNR